MSLVNGGHVYYSPSIVSPIVSFTKTPLRAFVLYILQLYDKLLYHLSETLQFMQMQMQRIFLVRQIVLPVTVSPPFPGMLESYMERRYFV